MIVVGERVGSDTAGTCSFASCLRVLLTVYGALNLATVTQMRFSAADPMHPCQGPLAQTGRGT